MLFVTQGRVGDMAAGGLSTDILSAKKEKGGDVRSRCGSSSKMVPGTAAKSYDLHLTSSYT